jgi:ribose transport system ATP-binding protein
MAGLVGAGRTELAETLFGIRPRTAGEVFLDDKEFQPASAGDAIQEGLLLLPEDRRHHGLILTQSIRNNLSLPNLGKLSNYSIINKQKENQLASESIRDLRIKTTSAGKEVGLLSGGNQQKVVFAKWIAAGPKVFILDEPTRGVDVGSKAEIYEIMRRLASEGVAILMISSDMEEILRLSDRVLVLHEGSLSGELSGSDINEEAIMKLATGA